MLVKTGSKTAEWEWDDDSGYIDDQLDVFLVARYVVDTFGNLFVVYVGEKQSGRYVWWAVGRIGEVQVIYTGHDRFNRWSGRGDDDWQQAADDAELRLWTLGFAQGEV